MESGEVIGISIVAVVAVIIIVIYICKCYSDYSLGHHEENIKPIDLDNEGDLALISVDCANPIPHDPYAEDKQAVALARKDHNDLEMVSLSVEQFIRKETYRKSMKSNQSGYKKLGRRTKPSSSSGIEQDSEKGDFHGISSLNEELDGYNPNAPLISNGYNRSQQAIEAPVIVHHSLGHINSLENQCEPEPDLNDHIYAPVEKSKPHEPTPLADAPTYFRPVKAMVPPVALSASPVAPSAPPVAPSAPPVALSAPPIALSAPPIIPPPLPKNVMDQLQDSIIKTDSFQTGEPAAQSIENVPPNEQQRPEENLFYVPEEALSPRTPKKSRRAAEKNLSDFGVTPEKTRTPKKKKDREGKPKGQKKRKKSVPDLDIAKPTVKIPSEAEPEVISPKSAEPPSINSLGMKSPPIPPKPKLNPLLSPTVQTRNEGNARVSIL